MKRECGDKLRRRSWLAVVASCLVARCLRSQNIDTPTLGGTQFWTDHLIHGGWRIQQNAVTGHYRLLDDRNIRRAWGPFETCHRQFEKLRNQQHLPPLSATVVLMIHGLGRTRGSMRKLAHYVAENSDWSCMTMSYASTRAGMDEHASALHDVLLNLRGVRRVHLVAHSMGNVVIRRLLDELSTRPAAARDIPVIGHIVMLAPPNHGAAMARLLKDNKLFQFLMGEAGEQLGPEWSELQQRLAVPAMPFGIVAGSTANGKGLNPAIAGDDDLIVGVEEAKLAGAGDFLVVSSMHTTIMNDPIVQAAVLNFLKHGYFTSAAQRHPLPVSDNK